MMEYGCIGEKLSHSFSAEIHRRLFDYEYILREIPREELDAFMRTGGFRAINVTIPYKEAVLPYLDEISATAQSIGAVNTVVRRGNKLYGDNTDFSGLCALIQRSGIRLEGKKVLILGSGGTSKTAAAVAMNLGCAAVYRLSRRETEGCITYAEALREHSDAQIIINTTPCGMFPHIGESAVDLSLFAGLEGVVDVVYNPLRSELVCSAQARGVRAVGGLYMLVAQAAFAAELFTGEKVPAEKIDAIYSELYRQKQNVVLIGMPGSGKSTVGKLLADRCGRPFIDLDERIFSREGMSAAEIIRTRGEAAFRDCETAAVYEASKEQGAIIATGGGAVLREKNVRLLRQNGRIYFLDRPLSDLPVTDDRPLSSDRERLQRLYEERYAIYRACCDRRIETKPTAELTAQTIQEDVDNEIACD